MRLRLQLSWLAFVLGGALGAYVFFRGQRTGALLIPVVDNSLYAALAAGYFLWGLYWGVPVVWRWWQNVTAYQRAHPAGCGQLMTRYLFTLILVPTGGLLYGICGGGLYQLAKALWLTRRVSQQSKR